MREEATLNNKALFDGVTQVRFVQRALLVPLHDSMFGYCKLFVRLSVRLCVYLSVCVSTVPSCVFRCSAFALFVFLLGMDTTEGRLLLCSTREVRSREVLP